MFALLFLKLSISFTNQKICYSIYLAFLLYFVNSSSSSPGFVFSAPSVFLFLSFGLIQPFNFSFSLSKFSIILSFSFTHSMHLKTSSFSSFNHAFNLLISLFKYSIYSSFNLITFPIFISDAGIFTCLSLKSSIAVIRYSYCYFNCKILCYKFYIRWSLLLISQLSFYIIAQYLTFSYAHFLVNSLSQVLFIKTCYFWIFSNSCNDYYVRLTVSQGADIVLLWKRLVMMEAVGLRQLLSCEDCNAILQQVGYDVIISELSILQTYYILIPHPRYIAKKIFNNPHLYGILSLVYNVQYEYNDIICIVKMIQNEERYLPQRISSGAGNSDNYRIPQQLLVRDELIRITMNKNVLPGEYIRVMSNIPNFKPIYQYNFEDKKIQLSEVDRKSKRKKSQSISMKPVFKFGSQLYLKTQLQRQGQKYQKNSNKSTASITGIQVIKNITLTENKNIFFEILLKGQYLTKKQNKEILLCYQSSNQSIWTIEQVLPSQYQIYNVADNCYLALKSGNQDDRLSFTTSKYPEATGMFEIIREGNTNYCTLAPCTIKRQRSIQASQSPGRKQNQDNFQFMMRESIKIQIIPISNSVVSLFYELKFSQEMLKQNPSFYIIHEIIQELIYYNIQEFSSNQGLLSIPIQKLLSEVGISDLILGYLSNKINEVGFAREISETISKDIRLLCLDSSENSQIFKKLVLKMLECADYQQYLECLINLVHRNWYFINNFQSQGWAKSILRKMQITYQLQEMHTFYNLMRLMAQFCLDNYSIPNKYLIMHTLEQIYDENYKSSKDTRNEQPHLWTKIFNQGQYVFVEVEDKDKLDEIQLQTFLNSSENPQKSEQNRYKYMAQINLLSAFCSGFNINAINRYYEILKAVSSYCYNETYPFFSHSQCKEVTMKAIATSFDWSDDGKKLENKYNIGFVFIDNPPNVDNTISNRVSANRQRVSTKHKIEQFKNFRNSFAKDAETFTDILKYFIKAFQSHIRDFLIRSQRKQLALIDVISPKSDKEGKFGCKISYWIKIINIALSQRLMTMIKKKVGPYTEYFKKIFENKDKSKQKYFQSPTKRPRSRKSSNSAPFSLPFIIDNEYNSQINIILDFLMRIVKYNPIYDLYLRQMKIRRDLSNKSKQRFIEKVFNIKKISNLFKQFDNEGSKQKQTYDKIMYMNQMVIDQKQESDLNLIIEAKLESFTVLSLIYQNILQEQIEQQVQNLGYIVKSSTKFSTNLSFEEGFKKFPYADVTFRLNLIQNWYLISNPLVLDKITTCIRFIYDQQQIYIRELNTTFLLFSKEAISFFQGTHVLMSQAQKLSACITTWYEPSILSAQQAYYENYLMLLHCLQGINNQIRKLNLSNLLLLVDYQRIIENLGILQISLNIMSHLNKFQRKSTKMIKSNKSKGKNQAKQNNKDLKKQSEALYEQLVKILEFYVHFNDLNKKKALIVLGDVITASSYTFKFLIFLLRQSTSIENSIDLVNQTMLLNIKRMFPDTKQFLEIVLMMDDFHFVKIIHSFSNCLQLQQMSQQQFERQKQILSDYKCAQLFSKITYRLLQISNCCTPYLKWFYDILLRIYLEKEVSENIHFKTHIVQNLKMEIIEFNSSVAFLLYWVFFDESLKISQQQRRRKVELAHLRNKQSQNFQFGTKLMSNEGQKLVKNYIIIQLLASVLETDTTLMKYYIEYYIFDLIPLLRICDDEILHQEEKRAIYDKSNDYLTTYTGDESMKSIPTVNEVVSDPKVLKTHSSNHDNTEIQYKNQVRLPEFKQRKMKQIQNFLYKKVLVGWNQPRNRSLIPSPKPQVIKEKKHNKWIDETQKNDEFDKMSKKAMKKWFKARLKLNENRENFLNRNKWLEDIQKLQFQYENQQQDREFVIIATDILSKNISILVNSHHINLSPQNQIFLLKCCLIWLKQIADEKLRGEKRKNKKQSKKIRQKVYLIKKLEVCDILVGILQQLEYKLNSKQECKNLIAICYQIKISRMLIVLCQYIDSSIIGTIIDRIASIVPKLTSYFDLHKELLAQFEFARILQSWEVMNSWIPIKLISQFTVQFVCSYEIGLYGYNQLCEVFLEARAMISKTVADRAEIGIWDVLSIFKQMSQETFRQQEQKLKISSELYETLDNLG